MIVRALDAVNDWTFGKGRNDYKRGNDAIAQRLQTRLMSFLRDCFFATNDGLDWFNLMGGKDLTVIKLSIASTILNTEGVTSMVNLYVNRVENRGLTIGYSVTTVYTDASEQNALLTQETSLLLTESGSVITTEDGVSIGVE